MRTFSEIVDALAETTIGQTVGLGDLILAVQDAIAEASLQNLTLGWDTVELNIVAESLDERKHWHLPVDFGAGLEVAYDHIAEVIPQRKLGGRRPHSEKYWYQAEDYIAFAGPIHHSVQIAYKRLYGEFRYYPEAKRLIRTAADSRFMYEYRQTPEDDWVEFSMSNPYMRDSYYRHANWFITRWANIILNGAKSVIYNDSGNLDAGGRMYSKFQNQLRNLKRVA